MSTPTKTLQIPWCEDDTNWFASHPNRTFRLRRLSDKERMDGMRYIDMHRKIPTHVLLMLKPNSQHTVRCHDGVGGGFFDLLIKSLDEAYEKVYENEYEDDTCADVVYAAIWGRTLLNDKPWGLEDFRILTKLKDSINYGKYQSVFP